MKISVTNIRMRHLRLECLGASATGLTMQAQGGGGAALVALSLAAEQAGRPSAHVF